MTRLLVVGMIAAWLALMTAGCGSDSAPRRMPSTGTEAAYRALADKERVVADRALAFYKTSRTIDDLKVCLKNGDVIAVETAPTSLHPDEGTLSVFLDPLHTLVFEFEWKTRNLRGYHITVNWG
jgi:hypothetical protein